MGIWGVKNMMPSPIITNIGRVDLAGKSDPYGDWHPLGRRSKYG